MNTQVIKSGASAIFGASVLGMVGILEGSISLGSTWSIGEQAPIIGALALVTAVALHGPKVGNWAIWELVVGTFAIVLPIAVFIGQPTAVLELFGQGSDLHPWTSLAVAATSYLGFWIATWR
jgi:hypothetical protein